MQAIKGGNKSVQWNTRVADKSTVEHGHDVDDDADVYKPKNHKSMLLVLRCPTWTLYYNNYLEAGNDKVQI